MIKKLKSKKFNSVIGTLKFVNFNFIILYVQKFLLLIYHKRHNLCFLPTYRDFAAAAAAR